MVTMSLRPSIRRGLTLAVVLAAFVAVLAISAVPSSRSSNTTSSLSALSQSAAISSQASSSSSAQESSHGINGANAQFHVPWTGATWFLGASPMAHGGPALVANLTQATVFDCASEAATANGCTREANGYPVAVWYPYSPGQGQAWPSWPNCAFNQPANQLRGGTNSPAYCISLGANDFIVAVPQPGPG